MKSTELRQLIRESINEYIREIDDAGNKAALEAKMTATQEAIDLREKKIKMDDLDEAYHDMLDKSKVKELGGEVKALKKSLDKLKKQLDKLNSKGTKTEKPEEKEEIVDEASPENGPRLEEDDLSGMADDAKASMEEMDIYEVLHMQKLASIISETEYVDKVKKAKAKKTSAKMAKKSKKDLFENEDYTPPAYETINDMMDEISQATGISGRIRPYSSISWLPKAVNDDSDVLIYKKGNQEIAVSLDFDSDEESAAMGEENSIWQVNGNTPELDNMFDHDLRWNEVVDQVTGWLES
jgi:hypothetical protein